MRKIFTVIINKNEYDVYDIEGKEHEGENDMCKTWWVYHSDRLPDGLFPPIDSPSWEPMHSSIERRLWELRFTQNTTTKEKWGSTHFRSSTWCEMWCNGKLIYQFGSSGGSRGMSFAIAKAQYLQTMLSEHCYNFFNPEEEQGRKIYYKGLPATIRVSSNPGEIGIVPDYSVMPKKEWWAELRNREKKIPAGAKEDEEKDREDMAEYEAGDYINWGSAFSDQHIDWFRKDNPLPKAAERHTPAK